MQINSVMGAQAQELQSNSTMSRSHRIAFGEDCSQKSKFSELIDKRNLYGSIIDNKGTLLSPFGVVKYDINAVKEDLNAVNKQLKAEYGLAGTPNILEKTATKIAKFFTK